MGPIGAFLAETAVADAQMRLTYLRTWDAIPNTGFKQAQNGANLRFMQVLARAANEIANLGE